MHADASMNETIAQRFAGDGFILCEAVIAKSHLDAIRSQVEEIDIVAGTRNLLEYDWCRELAMKLRRHPAVSQALAPPLVAMQCTLFEKTVGKNWLVALHQDLSIPVRERVDHPALQGWSYKEGGWYVQATLDVLKQMVAVRLHLDDCGDEDGPLRIVPGSHTQGKISNDDGIVMRDHAGECVCTASAGDALLMRPLLLHASSKSRGSSRRRVLHIVFAPAELPFGLSWHNAV